MKLSQELFQKTLVVTSLITLAACAGNTKKDAKLEGAIPAEEHAKNSVSIEAKLAAAQDDTSDVTEFEFAPNSSVLSQANREKLETALKHAEKKAKIKHVVLVTWSDQEMPKRDEDALSKSDRDLAKARYESLKKYIVASRKNVKISEVNMADRPSKINEFLKTNDARIQDALQDAGTGKAKASHAIVIIKTDRQKI